MRVNHIGVHTTHCCLLCGCKYGDDDCPVVLKTHEQEFICEGCEYHGIKSLEDLKKYMDKKVPICRHCGHINP
jgi:hypothetical protein